MNKRKKLRYQENLEKMGVEYLSELANNGQIYILNTKEQVTDLLDACRIEGISSKGYQTPAISQTPLPIFFAVVTYDYQAFFLLHSHDYHAVWLEVDSVLRAALHRIERLRTNEAQIKKYSIDIRRMTLHIHSPITCLDTFMKRNRRPSYLIQRIFQL